MLWQRTLGAVAFWVALLMPVGLFAQVGSSVLTGIVRDSSGGAISGAQVQVVNEDTGVSVDTVTNQDGLYRVGALVPGKYRVLITPRMENPDEPVKAAFDTRYADFKTSGLEFEVKAESNDIPIRLAKAKK